MTLIFDRVLATVEVHVRAKFHQASMSVPPERSSAALVTTCSKSVSICNRSHLSVGFLAGLHKKLQVDLAETFREGPSWS